MSDPGSIGEGGSRLGRLSVDRRQFLTAAGLATLGVVTGCTPASTMVVPPQQAAVATSSVVATATPPDLSALPGWTRLDALSAVSVAADAAADGYPPVAFGEQLDAHPAIRLLLASVARLSGGTAEDTLRSLVAEGGTVVIKPNWVEPASWQKAKITHPSLVLAMARLAAEVVGPGGRVIVAEGTSEGPDLPKILALTGFEKALRDLASSSSGKPRAPISIVDINNSSGGVKVALGGLSRFAAIDAGMYDGHGKPMGRIGDGRVGDYLVSRTILDADLVIDMAKVKVHSSAGITLALKNFVGIVPSNDGPYGDNSLKDVPHYSAEDVEAGTKLAGNRTIGRSAADLHAAARYTARDGSLQRTPQRKLLCIIDGVVCGQRSQFEPDAVGRGWIVAGTDPVAVDRVAARCAGFDPPKVLSLQPAEAGTLSVGTGDIGRIHVAYTGAGDLCGYFSKGRALQPERVRTDWSGRMTLDAFRLSADASVGADRRLVVRTAPGAKAHVVCGGFTAPLLDEGGGSLALGLPADPLGDVRVVVVDRHLNAVERVLRA